MDQPHQLHNHTAKRRRLHQTPGSWANPAEEQIEEPHLQPSWPSFYNASSGSHLTLPTSSTQQDLLTTVSSGFDTFTQSHINGQLSKQGSQSYETHVVPEIYTYAAQPTGTPYQSGPYNSVSSTSSWPDVRTLPHPPWLHLPVPPQLFQAHPLRSTSVPDSIASFQTPGNFQQPLEPSSTRTLPTFILDNEAVARVSDVTSLSLLAHPNVDQSEIVCFGMIVAISARCERQGLCEISSKFPAQIDSKDRFSATGQPDVHGKILSEHGQMIQGLLEEKALEFHVSCIPDGELPAKRSSRSSTQLPCVLDITLYGPWRLSEDIGTYFQDYEMFLQDPQVCHLDVRYYNPHRLSADDLSSCPLVSEVISQTSRLVQLQDIAERPDLLDVLSSHIELDETSQPSMIRTDLKRHQKQALTFMLQREQGWAFSDKRPDIWESMDTNQGRVFINRISDFYQDEEPPQFYGGIIADPMGLGKTLTMIALIATDLDSDKDARMYVDIDEDDKPHVSATLIIIPPPLLDAWEEQLSQHVKEGGLECRRHHGKMRLTDTKELDAVDVVLTTYHTISAEWKARNGAGRTILFSTRWRRIILDEAHFIRNGHSRMAHAICALDSVSRWAVTGTPIQNRLSDLATLLKFIRIHPYIDPKNFDADISQFWKSGEDEEAVKRLKRLSACLLLRRAKGTVNLPPRRDMQFPIDFTREERVVYDKIRQQAIIKIDEALHNNSETSRAGAYVNVLQQIESLRLFCNLGLHYHTRHDNFLQSYPETDDWVSAAQQTFNVQREMGPIICLQCSSVPEMTEPVFDDSTGTQQSPLFSRCLKFVCSECTHKLGKAGSTISCGHNPSCPISPISTSSSTLEEVSETLSSQMKTPSIGLPSKVEALVSELNALSSDVKCVVFSTWRLTLDIVEAGLDQASLRSIRFDGKVPQKERKSVVKRFKTDPNIRVMLLTLSCGAVGLTLTEASRAYLMEPHWNPTIEEQALARIHRIGQTRDVTTVRLYVRDSFEEQVMEVQKSKKQLASVLLSHHDGENMDDNLGGLHRLRSLL